MKRRFRKDDVETHGMGYGGNHYPAVNVKCNGLALTDEVMEEFNCKEEIAERALQWAWEAAVERFWEDAQETTEEAFGTGVKLYSAGRSGGWAVVEGLPDIESWGGPEVAKWGKFERLLKEMVEYLSAKENVFEDIRANRWAEPNAERYNFYNDSKTGETVCLADIDRCAHCKGKK